MNRGMGHHVRRQQSCRNWRYIAAIQSNRRRIHHKIDIADLKSKGLFFPRNRLQTRHRPKNFRTFKETSERIGELLSFFECAVRDDQPLAIFLRALKSDRAGSATGAKNENPKVAEIHRKVLPDRASKAATIGVKAMQFASIDL